MKTAKKAICMILTLVMALSCFVYPASAEGTVPLPATAGSVLTSGTYTVTGHRMIMATIGQSGLEIAPEATVTIILQDGAWLDITGGDSLSVAPAGAGIHVPEGSTLIVKGSGKLTAIGGDAFCGYNGGSGFSGQSHYSNTDWAYGGYGGYGGKGGGGAGAGIGGIGGRGGNGGESANAVFSNDGAPAAFVNGPAGGKGSDGAVGTSMGTVIVYGNAITVEATGGKAAVNGRCGTNGSNSYYGGSTLGDCSFGGGGGAGSGGLGGGAAADIGGGGGGGAGGGAGGGGAAISDHFYSFETDDESGMGGGYIIAGEYPGNLKPVTVDGEKVYGGAAGACGENGKKGGDGTYHLHFFESTWSCDETAHWHACQTENCCFEGDYSACAEASYGEHTGMEDGICDTCEYIDTALRVLYLARIKAIDEITAAAGQNPSDAVQALVDAAKDAVNTIQNTDDIQAVMFFAVSSITSLLSAENAAGELAAVKNDLAGMKQTLESVTKELTFSNQNQEALKKDLAAANEELAALKKSLTDSNQNQADLKDALDEANSELEAMKEALTESNQNQNSLKDALDEANRKLDGMETELSQTKEELAKLSDLLGKALEALENGGASDKPDEPGSPDEPAEPDEPASGVCARCGHAHADNFFGKIVCFFNRVSDMFINLFK